MLFPVLLLVPIVASVAIYYLFVRLEPGRHYWATITKAAATIATLRIALASAGAYLLENTSGWLQLPAYLMALCGLPEMILLPRPSWGRTETLLQLAGLIIVGTAGWICAIAALATYGKRRHLR
jgi:hypothetical protein